MQTTHRNSRARIAQPTIGMYPDGRPYTQAFGRNAPQESVVDRMKVRLAVVDLDQERPTAQTFLRKIGRELKIRFYLHNTNRNYASHLKSFLRWFGGAPHAIRREHVRCYLEYLVDAGLDQSTVGNHLCAIRTAFDKFCYRDVTLGLATPRKPKRLPIVLSHSEIERLLSSAIKVRDKLLLGLMYATGLRVSEVVELTYRDIDFDRQQILVRLGKGAKDRCVPLPKSLVNTLKAFKTCAKSGEYLFPSESKDATGGRHISSRTVQRIVVRTAKLAGIEKKATPHILRHSFATHSFEDGCDIRRIQKVLGHVSLETTTIYVRVSKPRESIASPLDRLAHGKGINSKSKTDTARCHSAAKNTTGILRVHLKPKMEGKVFHESLVTLAIRKEDRWIYFTGITASHQRPGWVTISLPKLEHWIPSLEQLPQTQRKRFHDHDFYAILQKEITRKFLALQANHTASR